MNSILKIQIILIILVGQLFAANVCDIDIPLGDKVIEASSTDDLNQILEHAEAGSTILLNSGTYTIKNTLYIRQNNITLRGKSGNPHDVILDGNLGGSTLDMENFVNTIIAVQASNVNIAHLSIRHARHHGIHITPTNSDLNNILLHDLHVYDCSQQQIKVNSNGNASDTKWVDNSTLQCSTIEFTNNKLMQDNGGYYYTGGLDVHGGENWKVHHNLFRNIQRDGKLMEHAVHFWNKCRGSLIENNTFINNYRAIGLGMKTESSGQIEKHYSDNKGDNPYYDHMDGLIRNNLIYNEKGIHLETGIEIMNSRDDQVYHNTIFSTDAPFNSIEFRWPNTTTIIKNNLFSHQIMPRNEAKAILAGNQENVPASVFQNVSELNFHLSNNAFSTMEKGESISSLLAGLDLDEQPIPQSPLPGAYQSLEHNSSFQKQQTPYSEHLFTFSKNPAGGYRLHTPNIEIYNLEFFNAQGKSQFQSKFSGNTTYEINLAELTPGMYFIKLSGSKTTQMEKVIFIGN